MTSFTFPLPDSDFDPVRASEADLAKFGIIPRPAEDNELYANWLRIFGPQKGSESPIKFVAPVRQEVQELFRIITGPARTQGLSIQGITRLLDSGDWSGGYIVPTDNTIVVLVAGQWTLPTLDLPKAEFQLPTDTQYACSTWVGLDGQRHYLNSSLPQIGVRQQLTLVPDSEPEPSATPFFQWWDSEGDGLFLELNGLLAASGDDMIGAVWANTATTVFAYLRNDTNGEVVIVGADAPSVSINGAQTQLTISGATAEWILERPTMFGSTDLYPFPSYSETAFDCWVGVARNQGPPERSQALQRARFIRMFTTLTDPSRTAFISMPRKVSDGKFLVDSRN